MIGLGRRASCDGGVGVEAAIGPGEKSLDNAGACLEMCASSMHGWQDFGEAALCRVPVRSVARE